MTVHRAEDLDAGDRARWLRLLEPGRELENPFLRAEFAEAVASFDPRVRVAVIESGDGDRGYWAYEEIRPGVAGPVGRRIGCLQGVLGPRGIAGDPVRLLESAGLRTWRFDHLASPWEDLGPHCFEWHRSPYLDLSEGFESYLRCRLDLGRTNRNIENSLRKLRALERDFGSCRLELAEDGEELLPILLGWKRDQMRRSGHRDLFVLQPWVEPFLHETLRRGDPGFQGMLAALRVGHEVAAALYGLRSGGVLHGLFLGYDRSFARYSPGMVLLVELARRAPLLGLRRIELGKGDEHYKQTLASGSRPVAVGAVCLRRSSAIALRSVRHLKSTVARSAWGPSVKRGVGRFLRAGDRLVSRGRR